MFSIKRGRKGFTLIELLVVIAIIAILAAILFPVFARARRAAMKTSCLSNLKQLGTAINMYMQDYDECYPSAVGFGPALHFPFSGGPATTLWGTSTALGLRLELCANNISYARFYPNLIASYVKNKDIFVCPSIGAEGTWYTGSAEIRVADNYTRNYLGEVPGLNDDNDPPTSYIFNAWVYDSSTYGNSSAKVVISGASEANCLAPADAPIAWDMVSGRLALGSTTKIQLAHQDCINVLYVDGHAKTVSINPNGDANPDYTSTQAGWGHFWSYLGHRGWSDR